MAQQNNNRVNFKDFPVLEINNDDVSGSFNDWKSSFDMVVEMYNHTLGTEQVNNVAVNVFRGRCKLIALFHALGNSGRALCRSFGLELSTPDITYEQVMTRLNTHYNIEESRFVKLLKLKTVSQALGERDNEYLARVELYSRANANFFNGEANRADYATVTAVVGLRDHEARKHLMSQATLTWVELGTYLRSKEMVKQSNEYAAITSPEVKQEEDAISANEYYSYVNRVSTSGGKTSQKGKQSYSYSENSGSRSNNKEKSSKNWRQTVRRSDTPPRQRSDSPNKENVQCYNCNLTGHIMRRCPKVKCYVCRKLGHTSRDCPRRSRGDSSSSDSSSDCHSSRRSVTFKENLECYKPKR